MLWGVWGLWGLWVMLVTGGVLVTVCGVALEIRDHGEAARNRAAAIPRAQDEPE